MTPLGLLGLKSSTMGLVKSNVSFPFSASVNVALEGNLIMTEGTFSNFLCSYDDSYPIGNSSIYYIGDVGTEISKVLNVICNEPKYAIIVVFRTCIRQCFIKVTISLVFVCFKYFTKISKYLTMS